MSSPWNNQLVSLVIISAPSGAFAGIFVYSPAPAFGTLIGSWAAQSGVDPYGNSYPQGLNVTVGSISGTTFNGTNFIINNNGAFFYSGVPALGNLVVSLANNAGNDAFGNNYYEGVCSYQPSGGALATFVSVMQGGSVLLGAGGTLFSPFPAPGLTVAGSGQIAFQSGAQNSSTDTTAELIAVSQLANASGSGTPAFQLQNTTQLNIPAGGGPFISGEGFHAVSLPTTGGFTGTIRVKKLPWNAIWLDVQVQWTGLTGTTYNCGSLPDGTYYPQNSTPRSYNISVGDSPNTDLQSRIIIPASGALQIFTAASASGSGTTAFCGCSVMYPTN